MGDNGSFLQFHGAAREVTGSMHLIEHAGRRVALDCGLFHGRRAEAHEKNLAFPCEPRDIHAVVLSHAHIDHSGKLPLLVKRGFDGPIYCTAATKDLADVMLADSAHIQIEDAEYFNKKRAKHGERAIDPLYGFEDAQRTIRLMKSVAYNETFDVIPGVRARFHEAGHMLGSAGVRIELDRAWARDRAIVFTGDVGRLKTPILRDPAPLPHGDYLICESTYGGRRHGEPGRVQEEVGRLLIETFARGGKVVVPAFAVGRTQMLVYYYHKLLASGVLRDHVPLYVDSPLAVRATEVFERHPECYDREAKALHRDVGDLLDCSACHFIEDVENSKKLHGKAGPMIIIAASGMCETGRILHHLKNNVTDPKNLVLIVGFQAAHTLGRRLIEKASKIRIFGEEYPVRAKVHAINGLSSHADADELRELTQPLAGACGHAFLVHGEPDQSEALRAVMTADGFTQVTVPARGDRVAIE